MPEQGPRMNGFSLGELCWLFCCPPCPSRIAAKLAFLPPEPTYTVLQPEQQQEPGAAAAAGTPTGSGTAKLAFLPPEPTYTVLQPEQQQEPGAAAAAGTPTGSATCSLHLSERADWQYSQRELDAVEVFFSRTARDNRLGCMFVRCAPTGRYTLLFSHGNAVDLGQMCSFYIGLGSRINCNVFSYDYSGYGVSTGKPSEKNLYADIDAAWQALRTRYGVSPENIILYGQSIGTVPTVDLASRYECAAVILHSPLMSGLRVAFPDTRKTYCFDAFPSIDKISKVTSPVLVIHGTEDEVIDFSHGLAMYERCPRAVEPLWVEGAGHNDIELYAQYLERLKQFISHELPNS
ncbi:PREDICTED: protein ABHD17C isoform X2 [Ficedula albicollis]|uniref:protein ABHD17C isoform X2 n=1 Tax=Ficedula albicollis TaxID=59894 RepID=UPI00035A135C|nr:PREDICTED: protein ABHD17C isoform X2 [Ficedula albicollis]